MTHSVGGNPRVTLDLDAPLPSYEFPPVVEVVVGVALKPIVGLTVAHLGAFWSQAKISSHFPKVEEQATLVPPLENFAGGQPLSISFALGQTAPRLWLLTSEGEELIQLQRDWFACNWRKVGPNSEYGRWPERREALIKWFGEFADFVEKNELGRVEPTQCEVTYVDHVPTRDFGSGTHAGLNRLLKLVEPPERLLGQETEQTYLSSTYVIPDDDGKPVGRLHVDAQPAFRRDDNMPIYVLNFTARGRPEGDGLDGALRFLKRGRFWAVSAFAELTTEDMQRKWGRK
jgi:uncharacterized protein (TIGR04255 family)